jgi:murein DD-endopeptidase MepM/ murein hydrolase activator NlpD
LQERLALTPEADRRVTQLFLPLVVKAGQSDVNPLEFSYTLKPGDTLWSLALDFGRDLDTMSCVTTPTGADAEKLTPGDTIAVPALSDLCYTVRPGDTLQGIAAQHKSTVAAIVAVPWNGFYYAPYRVIPKQRILIPGARTDAKPRADRSLVSRPNDQWGGTVYQDWPYGDGHFIWPVEGGWISQGAGPGHMAVDIAVPLGTSVRSADRGKVLYAGWNPSGYGFRVVIDHGTDYVTLYAHLSDIYVEAGQVVGKGQVIGLSGANGNITGPHLHFEVRDYGRLVDPRTVLP